MRLLLLTHCFYPSQKRGGPTVSMTNMAKLAADFMDVSVVTIGYDSDGTKYNGIHEGKNSIFGCDVYYLQNNKMGDFAEIIQKIAPDVMYISSLFSWQYCVPALRITKKKKIRTILAPRGELMPSAFSMKHSRKNIYLNFLKCLGLFRNIEIHATSNDEYNEVKKYFPHARICNVQNLPTVSALVSEYIEKSVGQLEVAFVGRIHPIKNLDVALNILKNIHGNVTMHVYGSCEVPEYYDKCKEIANSLPNNIQVRFEGNVPHDSIPQILSGYHVLLSPTQSENFGQAIVEMLMQHRPVVISTNTPWRELAPNRAGYDIALDQLEAFAEAINGFVDMNDVEFREWCDGAGAYISERLKLAELAVQYRQMLVGE